jgi:hypothetical protein
MNAHLFHVVRNSEIFREKKVGGKNYYHVYDENVIENMKQYFKVEDDHDALLDYLKKNTVAHDREL